MLVRRLGVASLACLAVVALAQPARAERVKDLATVAGVRGNQLVGYGLVVGLDGTGDQTSQTPFTIQTIKNMLKQLGVLVPDNVNPQLRNVAAVTVQATLPPFSKPGQTIDITVSSIGNAQSLRGGSLLMTPLRGGDGEIYALAQGNLIVGGFGVKGDDGSRVTVNVPSTGRVPNGATVEKIVPSTLGTQDAFVLNLNTPDFTTAAHLADSINKELGGGVAETIDPVSVRVRAPTAESERVAYISHIENLEVEAAQPPAKVIVNSRTGTVVIGVERAGQPGGRRARLARREDHGDDAREPARTRSARAARRPRSNPISASRSKATAGCSCSSPARRSTRSSRP